MYEYKSIDRSYTNSLKWDVKQGELPMWLADMDFATAPEVQLAVMKRAEHPAYGYSIVPDSWYQAYINWWKERHGFEIKKEWLAFATGVVPIISCLVKRLSNVGDSVACMTPVYNIFFNSIENAGRHVIECPLDYADGQYSLNFDKLKDVLSQPLTTLLILCNPHNPVGKLWSAEELSQIAELCKRYGVTVISDEIHCDIVERGYAYTPFASVSDTAREISVTCLSASKAFNLAGLQSAAVCVPCPSLRNIVVRGINSDEVAEPNCFAVQATEAAFTQGGEWLDGLNDVIAQNRRRFSEFLKGLGLGAVEAHTLYLMWVDMRPYIEDTTHFVSFLREKTGLILSCGEQYRGDGRHFVRINLATDSTHIDDAMRRFALGFQAYLADHH